MTISRRLPAGAPATSGDGNSGQERSRQRHRESEQLVLPVDLGSGRPLRRALLELCRRFGVDEEAAGDFALAATEALSNAVRHGTGTAQEVVVAEIRISSAACCLSLRYPGEPFPLGAPCLPEATSTHGRGRYLMSQLADRVDYTFTAGVTQIRLYKRWRSPGE